MPRARIPDVGSVRFLAADFALQRLIISPAPTGVVSRSVRFPEIPCNFFPCPDRVQVFFTSLDMFVIFIIVVFISPRAISNQSWHVGVCLYWLIFLLIVIAFSCYFTNLVNLVGHQIL